jgi:NTE family protein
MSRNSKTVALALGSGGARGYAHVGAIEILEERGYEIIAVSGCSMGALVGGIYAAGKLKEFKDWATGLDRFDILKLLDLSFSSPGAIRGDKVFSVVKDLIDDTLIENLAIAYTAVATDLLNHKEVWFQEGLLRKAIRASVAIPSLMTPEMVKGRVLVDGGLLNPLPIIPTISAHADLIVAVNLSYYDVHFEQRFYKDVEVKEDKRFEDWVAEVWGKATLLFDKEPGVTIGKSPPGNSKETACADSTESVAVHDVGRVVSDDHSRSSVSSNISVKSGGEPTNLKTEPNDVTATPVIRRERSLTLGKFDAMNMAFEAMQSSLTQYKLAGYPPDILVNIPKVVCKTFDYHKAPELIQLGRELTEKALDSYENGNP